MDYILHSPPPIPPAVFFLQTELLNMQIQTLQRVLKPGMKRLNWNSLGITDYVSRCEQAIIKFESLVNQVQKNASDIEERLNLIENVRLFKIPPTKLGCDLPEAKVVCVCVCVCARVCVCACVCWCVRLCVCCMHIISCSSVTGVL